VVNGTALPRIRSNSCCDAVSTGTTFQFQGNPSAGAKDTSFLAALRPDPGHRKFQELNTYKAELEPKAFQAVPAPAKDCVTRLYIESAI
jgi:hypothetical protein